MNKSAQADLGKWFFSKSISEKKLIKKVVLTFLNSTSRISRPEVLYKNGVLKNFAKLTQAYHFTKKILQLEHLFCRTFDSNYLSTFFFLQLRLHF